MIDVKEAADLARKYFLSLHEGRGVYQLALEEVELSNDERYWLITLSYSDNPILAGVKYKTFKIDAESGRVFSMKIRAVS
jgi:hypothetical protein